MTHDMSKLIQTALVGIFFMAAIFAVPEAKAFTPCPPGIPEPCEQTTVTASSDQFGLENAAPNSIKKDYTTVTADLIQAVLGMVGVVFLLLIIWGGFSWMTSGGNEQKITAAKQVIIGAVVGLVIIMAAYAITYFVINSLTGATSDLPSGAQTIQQPVP